MTDDTISRQMALDTIADYERDSVVPIDYRAIIESLPTVEPQTCKGCKYENHNFGYGKCEICKRLYDDNYEANNG